MSNVTSYLGDFFQDVLDGVDTHLRLDVLFEIVKQDTPKKWDALRKIHAIIDAEGFGDPYAVDWTRIFTPIEYLAWCGFRYEGLAPKPQYPVGSFFVDFAFPEQKIAFECDGKQYHDAAKDKERDHVCASLGWTVYRATGSECSRYRVAPWERDETISDGDGVADTEALDWLNRTSDGLIFAISRTHFHPERNTAPFTPEQIQGRLWMASINSMV